MKEKQPTFTEGQWLSWDYAMVRFISHNNPIR